MVCAAELLNGNLLRDADFDSLFLCTAFTRIYALKARRPLHLRRKALDCFSRLKRQLQRDGGRNLSLEEDHMPQYLNQELNFDEVRWATMRKTSYDSMRSFRGAPEKTLLPVWTRLYRLVHIVTGK